MQLNAKLCTLDTTTKKGDCHLYDNILETSHNEKELEVVINDNTHSAAASKKANQILGIIKKSYTSRDPTIIGTLIKTMVRPHLEYGNAIWGPFYMMDKEGGISTNDGNKVNTRTKR